MTGAIATRLVVPNRVVGGLGTADTIASAKLAQVRPSLLDDIGTALKPKAVLFAETHRVGGFLSGGNAGFISLEDGSVSYFGLKPIGRADLGPLGEVGIGIVGTNNGTNDEAGLSVSTRIPTPAGDLLLFATLRQDGMTIGNLIDLAQGRIQNSVTVSLSLGVAYSVSDGALLLLANSAAPGAGVIASSATAMLGADAWLGLGYRGTVTFEGGKLKSFNINGIEIPAGQIGEVLGKQVQEARKSPPIGPNLGSNAIASRNDDIQYAFGQSPWQVGFSAQDRDSRGALKIRDGTVDVLNHGNHTTALTEPVYELGVKYGALRPGQRITSNAQAGGVIDQVLNAALALDTSNKAKGAQTNNYLTALNRFQNAYNLDFGSAQLQAAQNSFNGSSAAQTMTNASRAMQGLAPLPIAGKTPRPADYNLVRGIFQGDLRYTGDNPSRPQPLPQPSPGGLRV